MKLLNVGLMSHWQNWATILLMVLIAIFAVNSLAKLIIKESEV